MYTKLHTSELNDGYDWGRLNLQSVTEQSSLDDFLATAELAGTEFTAGTNFFSPSLGQTFNYSVSLMSMIINIYIFILEKLNIRLVPAEARSGLPTAEESMRLKKLHEDNRQFLRIPRRLLSSSVSPLCLQAHAVVLFG